MKDRIPTPGLEGRLLITPEDGSPAFYAKAAMADNPTEQGTPFATATMLTDETAALFGMGGEAVPNAVLAFLGKYNQHWWRLTALVPTLVGKEVTVKSRYTSSEYFGITPVGTATVYASEEYAIDQSTGEVTLVDPVEVTVSDGWKTESMLGKWIMPGSGTSFHASTTTLGGNAVEVTGPVKWPDSTDGYSSGGGYIAFSSEKVFLLDTTTELQPGETEYVQSNDENAYPHGGDDGYFKYEYFGVPFNNSVTAIQMATGSYEGTEEATKEIAVGFRPKIFILTVLFSSGYTEMKYLYFKFDDGMSNWFHGGASSGDQNLQGIITDTGVSITAGGDEGPFGNWGANASGKTYRWYAIA